MAYKRMSAFSSSGRQAVTSRMHASRIFGLKTLMIWGDVADGVTAAEFECREAEAGLRGG